MDDIQLLQESLVLFLTLLMMGVGLVLTVIPPGVGNLVIWGSALGYGLIMGWEELGWLAFIGITFFMLLGLVGDVLGGQFGAKIGGASCLAMIVGMVLGFGAGIIASLVATPIVGCLAGIAGTVGGILLVERVRYGNWEIAINAVKGYLTGHVLGIVAKVVTGLIMIGIFLLRVYVGG